MPRSLPAAAARSEAGSRLRRVVEEAFVGLLAPRVRGRRPVPRRGGVGRSYARALPVGLLAVALGCAPYHTYWGDVHGHTGDSDGRGTVAEYLTHARGPDARLDFAIVTDHDFGNGPPWRLPQEVWKRTQEVVEAATVPGEFVAIAGYEWTSQAKYWSKFEGATPSEGLFEGAPRNYNHKIIYFPCPVPYIFSAKDSQTSTPDLLASAVARVGGLVHNAHPGSGPDASDQWDYTAASAGVIVNTEVLPNVLWHEGTRYELNVEDVLGRFLGRGGKTGFVGGSDTHDGKPSARTAVLARELTREAIFDALRHRRCYAITNARIALDFRIQGHWMGEEVELAPGEAPALSLHVEGTQPLAEVSILRNGVVWVSLRPGERALSWQQVDDPLVGSAYYFVRVTQVDADAHGNPSRAWSSPIWVKTCASGEHPRSAAELSGVHHHPGPRR